MNLTMIQILCLRERSLFILYMFCLHKPEFSSLLVLLIDYVCLNLLVLDKYFFGFVLRQKLCDQRLASTLVNF